MATCYAKSCERRVKPGMLMCLRCWRRVPKRLQIEVWRAYDGGRGLGTEEYQKTIDAARAAVRAGT